MKKLTLAISALAATVLGTSAANAEISVSGSGSAAYVNDASSNANIVIGQFVNFSMSTTTANGVTISGGMGLSNSVTAEARSVSGGQTLSFATGGATITVGDVVANDTPGSVGGVVGTTLGEQNGFNSDVEDGFGDDDGLGLSLSTAVGGSTLSLVYVANDNKDSIGQINSTATGADAITSATVTIPMGMYTITAGVADSDSGESASGASVSANLGGGTLTVGYSLQTLVDTVSDGAHNGAAAGSGDLSASGDTTVTGASYAMALDADTSVSVGIANKKDADDESTSQFDASISRSLGGGASVFLDIRSLSGDATTKGSAVAIGTSVSF